MLFCGIRVESIPVEGKKNFGQKAFCVVATNTMSRDTPNEISTDIHDEII